MDEFYRTWRDQSLKAYVEMLTPVIESNAFAKNLGVIWNPLLNAQKILRKATLLALDVMEIPSRQDLAQLSHRTHLAEKRSLVAEERLEDALATTTALEQRLAEATQALAHSLAMTQQHQDRLEAAIKA